MTIVDSLLIIALGIGVVRGFTTGIIKQLTSLAGIILAIMLAIQLMGPLGLSISEAMGWGMSVSSVLAFLLIFCAVGVAMGALAKLLEKVIGLFQLTILNRFAGALFGGLKAALIMSVVLMLSVTFDFPDAPAREASLLYDPVASLVPETWDMIAEHLPAMKMISDEFSRGIEELVQDQ